MSENVKTFRIENILKVCAATAALVAFFYMTSDQPFVLPSFFQRKVSKEDLLEIIQNVTSELYSIFNEVAQISANVRKKMGPAAITDEQMESILLQHGVQEKIKLTQQKVFQKYNTTDTMVQKAKVEYADCPKLKKYTTSLDDMCKESVKGILPIMPGIVIPKELTPEETLKIISEINAKKMKAFKEFLENNNDNNDSSLGYQDGFAQALTAASEKAEEEVLSSNKLFKNYIVFQCAIATYNRTESFKKKKEEISLNYQNEIVNLLKKFGPDEDKPKIESLDD